MTDFGMSKMANINPHKISIALSPENKPFMPPEIFLLDPSYSEKVDIFSAGVLTIQTITRKFPAPTKSKCIANFSSSPTGVIEVSVPEIKRRNNDISLISPTHPLLPVPLECLKDMHGYRPSAGQLCQRLAALKEAPLYAESMQGVEGAAGQGNISTCTSLEKKERDSDELQGQPQQKGVCQQETLLQLAEKDEVIQAIDKEIQANNEEMRVKSAKNEMVKAKNTDVHAKLQEVTHLQKSLKERNDEAAKLPQMVEKMQGSYIRSPQSIHPVNLPPAPKYKVRIVIDNISVCASKHRL